MFGALKRIRNSIGMTDLSANNYAGEDSESKRDKKFIIAVIILAVSAFVTLVRAFYDPAVLEDLKKIEISVLDIILLTAAVIGSYIVKKRGKK